MRPRRPHAAVAAVALAASALAAGGPAPSGAATRAAGCPVFPADNAWNTDISDLPVHPNSRDFIRAINASGSEYLHADFGGGGAYGIPFDVVPADQEPVPIRYRAYGDESDPGPFPIPRGAHVEGGRDATGDRHVLVLQRGACRLYELYRAFPTRRGWAADSGATWDLRSNRLRPRGWTSADAAGLPILPGLVRYRELERGEITHALRVTMSRTQRGYVTPARHFASSSTDRDLPPMGLRLRLKAGFDLSRYHGHARVILRALRRYGLIVADNGANWFISGRADPRFDDEDLNQLKTVPGRAFEVVDTGRIHR